MAALSVARRALGTVRGCMHAAFLHPALGLILSLSLVTSGGCGREAPGWLPGGVIVTSTPAGAAIRLDGRLTGTVTPDTLGDVAHGAHVVRVHLFEYAAVPESLVVDVPAAALVAARFTLVSLIQTGDLAVVSAPSGAAIRLDGADTGAVTPDTLRGLGVGEHVVKVALAEHASTPESLRVNVTAQGLATASFLLSRIFAPPPQVALLEGFSNVSCTGCPAMNATLHALMATPGYGTDRVLLIKYAANWPSASDPHWLANPTDNGARLTFYQSQINVGLPTLFLDGVRAGPSGSPPGLADLRALVDARLAADPGFAIAVTATLDSDAPAIVTATATLTAVRFVEDPGAVLRFALVENPVVYATPPGSEGETEFHWIMRDFATAGQSPLPVAPCDPVTMGLDLARASEGWIAEHLGVIAFVQIPVTRAVLQAGYAPVQIVTRRGAADRARAAAVFPAASPAVPAPHPRATPAGAATPGPSMKGRP